MCVFAIKNVILVSTSLVKKIVHKNGRLQKFNHARGTALSLQPLVISTRNLAHLLVMYKMESQMFFAQGLSYGLSKLKKKWVNLSLNFER